MRRGKNARGGGTTTYRREHNGNVPYIMKTDLGTRLIFRKLVLLLFFFDNVSSTLVVVIKLVQRFYVNTRSFWFSTETLPAYANST